MGFREKNAWFCGVCILLIFIPYFYFSFQYPVEHVSVFLIAVVGLVVLLAGFHATNSIASKSIREAGDVPQADELDKLLELRASKWAGIVLAALVLVWSMVAMLSVPIEGVSQATLQQPGAAALNELDFTISATQALFWLNLMFAGFVISNLVYYGRLIASYRGFANG